MHCLNCGYPLKDLREAKCPECGQGFDPRDSRTFGDASRARFITAQLVGAVTAFGAFLVLSVTPVAAGHGAGFPAMLFMYPPAAAVALTWVGLCIGSACATRPGPAAAMLGVCVGGLLLFWGLILLATGGSLVFWCFSAVFLASAGTVIVQVIRLLHARRQYRFALLAAAPKGEEIVVSNAPPR